MEPRLDYYTASPEALKAILALEAATFDLSIEKPLLELVKVRVSQVNNCAFCADMHALEARRNGESERRLYAVAVWRDSPFFSDRERAALAWCESVTLLSQSNVPDEVYQQLRSQFDEREAVDLTVAISAINCWNRLAVSFRQLPAL
ncbi:alkylhydroperoxidase AhpD family core domain-containing protein [Pseudomonas delhiensis]|uniref:Alkylhydroperoxidase AhpD family core domain-containing protein n=1 Tax=Pseudomonas delhiensis TaxID=366289 RepID=A0A239MLU2_9PSED|nr:carboxymuconolactone decarboxylase family protein [Pseudomonas delhiensis]SDI20853.1 alkylhydroperoxidase AhpD family core domain-containing protein [Pseudomonas delhiensis]SNT43233.1 alkylhydroperoxidase AhpD family core domain-containing protein [Pseudomonas delhiensis]